VAGEQKFGQVNKTPPPKRRGLTKGAMMKEISFLIKHSLPLRIILLFLKKSTPNVF